MPESENQCPFCGMADTKQGPHWPNSFIFECGTRFIPAKYYVTKQDWSKRSKACEFVDELRRALEDSVDALESQQAMDDDSTRRQYEHLFAGTDSKVRDTDE